MEVCECVREGVVDAGLAVASGVAPVNAEASGTAEAAGGLE